MSEPSVGHGPSLTARIGSYPVFGAALTRAVTSLSCAYDNYGKHSSSPLVRRCVGAVESKLQPHLSRVEPVVHAGLDRLEGSVTTIRHTADTAVNASLGRIETTVSTLRQSAAATTIRDTADTAVHAGLGRIESTVTSIRSTADLAVRQWRHLPATINSAVASTAVKVEGRVAALASAGLTKADAVVGWALAHVAEQEEAGKEQEEKPVDAPAPVIDANQWPTPEETREHDAEAYAQRHHIPPAFGAETKRVLTHLRALTTKIASELLPATLFQIRQIPGRGCQAVRTRLCASTTAACGSVRGGVGRQKDRASARVRQMRRAVQARFTDVHLDNLIQQLFVFGLEGSARSFELLLRVTPDRVVALIRRKFGVDLRQVRRRLRILVNRAKAGQPIRPPTPTTPTPSTSATSATADTTATASHAATYSEVLKHPSTQHVSPSSSHTAPAFVAGASVSTPHFAHNAVVDDEVDDDDDDNNTNDPEENYSSDEVDDNETGDDEDEVESDTHEDLVLIFLHLSLSVAYFVFVFLSCPRV